VDVNSLPFPPSSLLALLSLFYPIAVSLTLFLHPIHLGVVDALEERLKALEEKFKIEIPYCLKQERPLWARLEPGR